MSKYANIINNLSRFDIDLQYITDKAVLEGIPFGQILSDVMAVREVNTIELQEAHDKSVMDDNLPLREEIKGVYTLSSVRDGIKVLKRSEKRDEGDSLGWMNVKLTLKPEIYTLTGIPGMGKSAWLDHLMINSIRQHGYKWAIFSPESLPIEEHSRTMIEIATGTNFYGKYGTAMTTDEHIDKVVDGLNDYLFFVDPPDDNALKIENILELMKVQVIENGINAFVLDPYNEFSHTRSTKITETEYVSHFLQKVRRFTKRFQCMAWIVAHPTKLKKGDDGKYPVPTAYDISGSGNWYNKSDNIIVVHRDKDKRTNPTNKVEIWIQKLKKKGTGELGCYELEYNYGTGTYSDAPRMTEEDMP